MDLTISDLLDKLKETGNLFISVNYKNADSGDTELLVLVAKSTAAELFKNIINELTKDWDASTEKITETIKTSATKSSRSSGRNKLGTSSETPKTEE